MAKEKELSAIEKYNAMLTPEERRERASKAGKASAEARRGYRRFRDVVQEMLCLSPEDPAVADLLRKLGVPATNSNAVALAQIRGALTGGTDAARWLRDTAGDKPRDGLDLELTDKPVQALDLAALTDAELAALADRETD